MYIGGVYMNVHETIRERRSMRRYLPREISESQMETLLEDAALYASGGNRQPVRYMAVTRPDLRERIFSCTRWAMYLPGFDIAPDQRPAGYIVLLAENPAAVQFDIGAAATTIMLDAKEMGLDSCCIGALDRAAMESILPVPDKLKIALVIALGYGAQVCRPVEFRGDVRYYEDDDGSFCVPKLSPKELTLFTAY